MDPFLSDALNKTNHILSLVFFLCKFKKNSLKVIFKRQPFKGTIKEKLKASSLKKYKTNNFNSFGARGGLKDAKKLSKKCQRYFFVLNKYLRVDT